MRNGEETPHAKFGRIIYGEWEGPFGAGLRCLTFQVDESEPVFRLMVLNLKTDLPIGTNRSVDGF